MQAKNLGLLLLLAALLAVAGAEEASEDDVEASGESGELGASEHAKTVTLFPDFPDQKFTQGQFVDVLCGFSNTGDKSFNITLLKGSLNSPMDYQYIQNFTENTPFTEIKEGDQGTIYYRFFPDPNLEPREYVLSLSVDYIDADKEEFQTVYFNQTVEIVESQSSQNSRTFFGRCLMLALLAAAGTGAQTFSKRFGGKKSKASAPTASKSSGSTNEWLQDTNIRGGATSSGKKGSKKA